MMIRHVANSLPISTATVHGRHESALLASQTWSTAQLASPRSAGQIRPADSKIDRAINIDRQVKIKAWLVRELAATADPALSVAVVSGGGPSGSGSSGGGIHTSRIFLQCLQNESGATSSSGGGGAAGSLAASPTSVAAAAAAAEAAAAAADDADSEDDDDSDGSSGGGVDGKTASAPRNAAVSGHVSPPASGGGGPGRAGAGSAATTEGDDGSDGAGMGGGGGGDGSGERGCMFQGRWYCRQRERERERERRERGRERESEVER
jgi:hypothetical protein